MGCDYMGGKSVMKNAQSPKMSCSLQLAAKIQTLSLLGPTISP